MGLMTRVTWSAGRQWRRSEGPFLTPGLLASIPTHPRLTVQRESALKTVIRTRPTEVQEIENLRKM